MVADAIGGSIRRYLPSLDLSRQRDANIDLAQFGFNGLLRKRLTRENEEEAYANDPPPGGR